MVVLGGECVLGGGGGWWVVVGLFWLVLALFWVMVGGGAFILVSSDW